MSRFTSAYSGLITRFQEVETLLKLAMQVRNKPPLPANIVCMNALCRSGVVLLSSHIEGYIEDLGEIALDRIVQRRIPKSNLGSGFRYYLSRDIILDIKNTAEPTQVVVHIEKLLQRDQHIWGPDSYFSQTLSSQVFLRDFANPTHSRIKKFFGRFGYHQFHNDLQRLLTTDFTPCSNMLDQVVDQRNKIAHGDAVITGSPSDLSDMIRLVKIYCRAVDHVTGNWFKTQGCSIR